MASCCTFTSVEETRTNAGELTVALAGNPNCGKTTLFNNLTGLRQKVANYPGVTVERKVGRCTLNDGRSIELIDLPGTYSLVSHSLDERVAMEVLRGLRSDTRQPDVVIAVVDASNLQRNLYLVSQLIELGRPLVIALNMTDIAERRGLRISAEKLSAELSVPVVPIVGHRKQGISQLKNAIEKASIAPTPEWRLPDTISRELFLLAGGLAKLDRARPASTPGAYRAMAERLLIGDTAGDLIDFAAQPPVAELLNAATGRLRAIGVDPVQADIEAHYQWIEVVAAKVVTWRAAEDAGDSVSFDTGNARSNAHTRSETPDNEHATHPHNLTQKVDAILVHKVWGLLTFAVVMAAMFISMFWLAQPIMDAMQSAVAWLGDVVTRKLSDGPIKSLLVDGIFKGAGAVVVFVPQIAILFGFLAILEDSGYLARAAFLMDRLLSKVGLHGKSFIPLLSSFACAIPGIMATRTIENRRDRLATIMVAPFMSCSARLPVYTLLIGTFFASYGTLVQGTVMLGLYVAGILAAAGTAFLFRRTLSSGRPSSFILELPTYKLPQGAQVFRQIWTNTSQFLTKAGMSIFCFSVILWAMAYYPHLPESRIAQINAHAQSSAASQVAEASPPTPEALAQAQNKLRGAAQSEYSLSGRVGHFLEPTLRPTGFDWKIGVGLVSAFAAREVFVSALGIVYSVGDVDADKAGTSDLPAAMRADRYTHGSRAGRAVWTPVVAVSLLLWFALSMQCMSTLAVVRRETGGWSWPVFMLVYMNGLAYLVSVAVYQLGTPLFGG